MQLRLPFTLLSLLASILAPTTIASSTTRNPLVALSTVDNATIHTHNHRLTALSEFHLSFNIRDDLLVKFHLEPNHDILHEDLTITYHAPDGSLSYSEPVDRLQHKVFKGTSWVQRPGIGETTWQRAGWARIYVTRDGRTPQFEGAFSVNHDHHHIQSTWNYMRTRHELDPKMALHDENGQEYMVVWRDSDTLPAARHSDLRRDGANAPRSCLSDELSFNTQPDHPVYMAMAKRSYGFMDFPNVFRRQVDTTTGGNSAGVNLASTIGQTAGCPTARKVALVGVATDCTYTADFSSNETAIKNVISQMSTASGIWEGAFNISLGLRNLKVMDAECPGTPAAATEWNQACSPSVDIQARLNLFSAWRGTQKDSNSHWTLLSTCKTGSAVGLAWLGQACVQSSISMNSSATGNGQSTGDGQTVSGTNVVIRTQGANEWQIISHETGHTYGAVHDCDSETCQAANTVNAPQCCPLNAGTCDAQAMYIMNPATSAGVQQFSPCSIGNICSALERNSVNGQCLTDNKNVKTVSGQQCGNGIVEPGEDCDCGDPETCGDSPCCDPTSCKFKSGAVCDDANEDCCQSCQFATKGTVCRASTGDCDPQEVCPGTSATCPADTTMPDGQSCGDGVRCASGQCTSRDLQCKLVLGGTYSQGHNDTTACDGQSCTISCASPEFSPGMCYSPNQNYLDGTNCGGNGHCENGQCKGSSVGGQIKSWVDDHKAIVIGVCSAVGGLLVLAILSCLFRSCARRRARSKQPLNNAPPNGGWQGWTGPPPPMQQQRQRQPQGFGNDYPSPQHPSQGWFTPPAGGNAGWSPQQQQHATPPPPVLNRGSSVRYA